jgi:hypothetical protein
MSEPFRSRTSMTALAATVVAGVFGALPALAQTSMDYGLDYAQDIGLPDLPLQSIITKFIRALLGFVGFAMVLQIMYAGFLMMTHGGKEEAKEKAIAALTQSVVGLVIIMSASSAARFVIDAVTGAAQNAYYS